MANNATIIPFSRLNDEQRRAVNGVLDKKVHIIKGAGGTGKSHIIKAICDAAQGRVKVLTPTHSARFNLEARGITDVNLIDGVINNAQTRNSLITNGIEYILVDEASMVSRMDYVILWHYICDQGRLFHLVFLGDPAQLPPISESLSKFNDDWFASVTANITLTAQHRHDGGMVVDRVNDLHPLDMMKFDIVICSNNDRRHAINAQQHILKYGSRATRGKVDPLSPEAIFVPQAGQRLVCRETVRGSYINNFVYTIKSVAVTKTGYDVMFEGGRKKPQHIPFEDLKLNSPTSKSREARWHFGYAVTCHTAQGQQFNNVLVDVDGRGIFGDDQNEKTRWLYTAMSRAIQNSIIYDRSQDDECKKIFNKLKNEYFNFKLAA